MNELRQHRVRISESKSEYDYKNYTIKLEDDTNITLTQYELRDLKLLLERMWEGE